jgi:hypothetical protein
MENAVIAVILILLIAIVFGALRERRSGRKKRPHVREHYGPPPGMYRALSHEELDSRGWPEYPLEYTANTASSISHLIERSA